MRWRVYGRGKRKPHKRHLPGWNTSLNVEQKHLGAIPGCCSRHLAPPGMCLYLQEAYRQKLRPAALSAGSTNRPAAFLFARADLQIDCFQYKPRQPGTLPESSILDRKQICCCATVSPVQD